jgi:hypothetical protein
MKRVKRFSRFVLILITGLAAAAAAGASDVNAQLRGDRVIREAERISRDVFEVSVTTPRGARVYAVRRPTAKVLAAIDKGLADLFAIARRNGYRNRLNYSDYTIFIARADRRMTRDGQYSPDIAVPTGQYAGSVYDQGGFIYAAGMVISNNPPAFIIAEHERELERISEIVRYEGEHLVLFHNDRRRYHETADHSRGGGHPILQ